MVSLFSKFYPFEYVESVFSIDYNKLYDKGYRGIIFDIDNTLVPHGKPSTVEVDSLFVEIQGIGFKTFLLSNNGKDRINMFLKNIDCPYIDNADKPKPKNYLKAVELFDLPKEQIVYIGDQVIRDIYGSNRAGIDSILVKFIGWQNTTRVGIRRRGEAIILWFYSHSRKYKNRIGDILKEEYCNV